MRGSRRYRRLYWRASVRFWLLGIALCVVAAVVAIAVKILFDVVGASKARKAPKVRTVLAVSVGHFQERLDEPTVKLAVNPVPRLHSRGMGALPFSPVDREVRDLW